MVDPWYPPALLKRLGLPEPKILGLATHELTPTMQILDFTKASVSEPSEARGYIGHGVAGAPGLYSTFELVSVAPNGSIVEGVWSNQEVPNTGAVLVSVLSERITLGVAPTNVGFNCGGVPCRNLWSHAQLAAPLSTSGTTVEELRNALLNAMRIYLAAGQSLVVQCALAGVGLSVAVKWRELAEVSP